MQANFSVVKLFERPRIVLSILGIVNLLSLTFQLLFDRNLSFIPSEVVFIVISFLSVFAGRYLVTTVFISVEKMAYHTGSDAKAASRLFESDTLNSILLTLTGITVATVAIQTHVGTGIPWEDSSLAIYLVSVFCDFWVIGVAGGLYLLSVVRLGYSAFLSHFPQENVSCSEIVARVGGRFHSATVLGTGIYLLALLGVYLSPGSETFFKYEGDVRNFWILPMAFSVFGYFVAYQYSIHVVLSRVKDSRISALRRHQELAFSSWLDDKNEAHASATKFLGGLIEQAEKENTWPADVSRVLLIVVPTLLPASTEIVELFNILFVNDVNV